MPPYDGHRICAGHCCGGATVGAMRPAPGRGETRRGSAGGTQGRVVRGGRRNGVGSREERRWVLAGWAEGGGVSLGGRDGLDGEDVPALL